MEATAERAETGRQAHRAGPVGLVGTVPRRRPATAETVVREETEERAAPVQVVTAAGLSACFPNRIHPLFSMWPASLDQPD